MELPLTKTHGEGKEIGRGRVGGYDAVGLGKELQLEVRMHRNRNRVDVVRLAGWAALWLEAAAGTFDCCQAWGGSKYRPFLTRRGSMIAVADKPNDAAPLDSTLWFTALQDPPAVKRQLMT